MHEQFVPVRSDDVVHFPAGDQICLHHLDTGEYFLLNETAGFVWEYCGGEFSVAEIAARLADEFEVDLQTAVADVQDVVRTLAEQDCFLPALNPA